MIAHPTTTSIALCLSLGALLSSQTAAFANNGDDRFKTIALIGTQAPGFPANQTYQTIDYFAASDVGKFGFNGSVGVGTDAGVWAGDLDAFDLVARTGQQIPGFSPGDTFPLGVPLPYVRSLVVNDSAATAARYQISTSNQFGIWMRGTGPLSLVAASGQSVPGLPGGTNFAFVGLPLLNNANQVAFTTGMTGPGVNSNNNFMAWLYDAGVLHPIIRAGVPMPGVTPAETFRNPGIEALNDNGRLLVRVDAVQSPGTVGADPDDEMYWQFHNGALELFARENDLAPGGVFQERFDGFRFAALSDNDHVLLYALVRGPQVTEFNNQVLWVGGNGHAPRIAVRTGEQLPGMSSQESLVDLLNSVTEASLNDRGDVAFLGNVGGPNIDYRNQRGLWANINGTLIKIVRNGDMAVGEIPGLKFIDANFPRLDGRGQVLFSAYLFDDVRGHQQKGIWARDITGQIQKIVLEGELIDVDNGPGVDLRTIADVGYFAHEVRFNKLGQIVFRATFTDGSTGVFLSNAVAVPEPAGTVLVVATILTCGINRRRRKVGGHV